MSRLDLRDPFMSLYWFGHGVSWGGHSMFCVSMISYFYVLADGSQSGTAVYRCLWLGTILRYPFSHLCLWEVNFVWWHIALSVTVCFVLYCLLFCRRHFLNKVKCTLTTLHLGPHLLPPTTTLVTHWRKMQYVSSVWERGIPCVEIQSSNHFKRKATALRLSDRIC